MDSELDSKISGPITIDVGKVLSARLGNRSRLIPRFLIRRLEKLIHQEEMNELLITGYPSRGSQFCRSVLDTLNIKICVNGIENLPPPEHKRVILASNHPLGGLDGMALINVVADYYGCEPLFIINDLLMAVEPLRDVFVPVNKHGAQGRDTLKAIDNAMAGDRPVIIFPAGLCSRRNKGVIADLEWQKMFVQKAGQWNRDIIPVKFDARNSDNFYNWANRRRRLGIKFNAEMILLPDEIFKSRGKTFKIHFGKPVSFDSLPSNPKDAAMKVRNIVYSLPLSSS